MIFGLPFELPNLSNFETLVYEIIFGVILASIFYYLQLRTSRKVDDLIRQKAEAEHKKKNFECQRIIENLQELKKMETDFMEYLTNYQGEQTNEWLKFSATLAIIPIFQSIGRMRDAVEQLQWMLTDNSLRGDFLKYLNWFNLIPKRILEDGITDKMHLQGQEHLVKGLIQDIDEQMKKIQYFIDKFTNEMTPVNRSTIQKIKNRLSSLFYR